MSDAVEVVAALEAEARQAASAAEAAQAAAKEAQESAAVLAGQVIVEAAAEIQAVEKQVEETKDETQWLKERMSTLEASMTALAETQALILARIPEPASPASEPSTPEPAPLQNVEVVLPEAAKEPEPSPPAPAKPQSRHRRL